ncbi:putative mitochondrial protein [Cucumis melo var. makuwa]|uniref:Putative mitochondrial protein n=1 Tax=Cucumis melo var. makuwa TaxID=1194695 RepID=A0A5D3BPY5_CUCMM|nr:putative mitochondrial protein [Cucumis melo var. makuwa]
MNFSYQGCHPPSQLATMVVNSMHSQASGENTNNVWFSDSGCNVHMTYELTNLNLSNNYNGDEIVTVDKVTGRTLYTGESIKGNEIDVAAPNIPVPLPSRNTHAMQTLAKSGIFKPKAFYIITALPTPTSYTEGSKYSEWRTAMCGEFNALQAQGT